MSTEPTRLEQSLSVVHSDKKSFFADAKELVVAMVRTGVVGYGGGPSIIPLIRHEAVNRYQWVTDDEFAEILALANTLPGPIATKMAAYLGYRVRGSLGAVISLVAHIFPTTLAMALLLGLLARLHGAKAVHGMIAAVGPVIVAMLAGMTYEFAKKAHKGLGLWLAIGFGAAAFVLLEVLHVPTAIVVLGYLAYGAIHLSFVARILSRRNKPGGEAT